MEATAAGTATLLRNEQFQTVVKCSSIVLIPDLFLQVVRLVYTNLRVICGQRCALKERTATQFMVVYMYLSVPLQL